VTPPTEAEQDFSLAAMIGTVAEGQQATSLDKAVLRLQLVRQAQDRGLSWAQIGSVYGLSGREMKREVHHLARRVRPGLMAKRNG
jgi:hypothetical protein